MFKCCSAKLVNFINRNISANYFVKISRLFFCYIQVHNAILTKKINVPYKLVRS